MNNELVLKSENAIEADSNKNKIGKSLVDLWKQLCVHPSIDVHQYQSNARHHYARAEGHSSYEYDYERPSSESATIKLSDGEPEIKMEKYYNNEYSLSTKHVPKDKYDLTSKDKWKRLLFITATEPVYDFIFVKSNPSAIIQHGNITLEISPEMFDVLNHFMLEQAETKRINGDIKKLSSRLETYGVQNPLKK